MRQHLIALSKDWTPGPGQNVQQDFEYNCRPVHYCHPQKQYIKNSGARQRNLDIARLLSVEKITERHFREKLGMLLGSETIKGATSQEGLETLKYKV